MRKRRRRGRGARRSVARALTLYSPTGTLVVKGRACCGKVVGVGKERLRGFVGAVSARAGCGSGTDVGRGQQRDAHLLPHQLAVVEGAGAQPRLGRVPDVQPYALRAEHWRERGRQRADDAARCARVQRLGAQRCHPPFSSPPTSHTPTHTHTTHTRTRAPQSAYRLARRGATCACAGWRGTRGAHRPQPAKPLHSAGVQQDGGAQDAQLRAHAVHRQTLFELCHGAQPRVAARDG